MLIDGKEWRLVPMEPTPKMVQASWMKNGMTTPDANGERRAVRIAWHAMLAAAPTPPAATAAPSDDEIKKIFQDSAYGRTYDGHYEITRVQAVSIARDLLSRYGGRQAPADWVAEADRLISAFVRAELGRNNEARQAAAHAMRQHLLLHPAAQAPAANGDALDAARYRWLRGHFRFAADSDSEIWFDSSLEHSPAEQLDAAIDAAIQRTTAQEGE